MGLPDFTWIEFFNLLPDSKEYSPILLQKLRADMIYLPYLKRHSADLKMLSSINNYEIPGDLSYHSIISLSSEMKAKLSETKPSSFSELQQVATPAAFIAVKIYLAKHYNYKI